MNKTIKVLEFGIEKEVSRYVKVTTYRQSRNGKGCKWNTDDKEVEKITLYNFEESFVKEKWRGEQRREYDYSPLGYYHHKAINENPYSNGTERTVREFEFIVF